MTADTERSLPKNERNSETVPAKQKEYILRFICGILFAGFGILLLCIDRTSNLLLATVEICFGVFEFAMGLKARFGGNR